MIKLISTRFKMTPIIKNKQFWTQNRQAVVRSAIVPVTIVMAAMTLINLVPIIDPVIVFIFGLLYLYVGKTLLILKYGNKLTEITSKSSSKKTSKAFALGNKTFTDEKLGSVAFTISITLICSVFLAAGWPDLENPDPITINPIELLQFVMPYWAFHLYCFITDNSLSILRTLKYGKVQPVHGIQHDCNKIFEENTSSSTKLFQDDWEDFSTTRGHPYCLHKD